MQNQIFLKQILKDMKRLDDKKNPIPFSISFRTYNQQNKMGGRLLSEENAVLMQAPKDPGAIRLSQKIDFKNPNHWKNHTRNIKTNSGIKTINIFFITKYNGLDVVL